MSGNQTLAKKFLKKFVEELPTYRVQLKQALKADDLATIKEIAHTLRGACGFSSLPKLESALAKLEYLAAHPKTNRTLEHALYDVIHHIDAIIEAYQLLNVDSVQYTDQAKL